MGFVSVTQPHIHYWLEKLMQNTDVIHITDKPYMQNLQACIKQNQEKTVKKRIHDREVEEMVREKRLILEGKMAAEEASAELANHPAFKTSQLAKRILNERRQLVEAQTFEKPKKYLTNDVFLKNLYSQCEFDTKSEMEVVIAIDTAEHIRAVHLLEIEEDIESGVIITQTDSDRLKYEHPLVKELRRVETVDEMYALAESIIGPTVNNRCDKRA